MGKIINSYIFPHPPIIIPEVGRGEEQPALKTIEAAKRAAADIKSDIPTTIIVTSPHGPVFEDYVYMATHEILQGDLSRFGAGNVKIRYKNNRKLVEGIIQKAAEYGIHAGGIEESISGKYGVPKELDHGVMVPLYFVNQEYTNFSLVHISIAFMPFEQLYQFGMSIAKAIEESDERVVFLASGDMSHRLSEEGPYGYSEEGLAFDKLLIENVKKMDMPSLLNLDEDFCEAAGECGLRSFLMLFGALDGYEIRPQVYSYEGPFGVGYSIMKLAVGDRIEGRLAMSRKTDLGKEEPDAYVSLAKQTLEAYVREGRVLEVSDGLSRELVENRAGVFVSLKKFGQLRGCIGTIGPVQRNIAEEIIHNAISAGTEDPRFLPVRAEELAQLDYSVDVLCESEPIDSIGQLDVIKYGVIVRSGRRSGLLLPNLEGVDTPEEQVEIALQKAGIRPGEKYSMERFEVVRHK